LKPVTPKNGFRSSGDRKIATRRAQRIEAQISREVSDVIERQLDDPAIGFVTVQSVSVTSDLREAIVFVAPLGDAHSAGASLNALQRAAAYVRRELAARIRVYRIPRIRFQLDPEMLSVESRGSNRASRHCADVSKPTAVTPRSDDR
jgi:ribosome-binding factor A